MDIIEHRTIYSDPFSYCAHPHGIRLASGDILIVFNRAPRRPFVLHPPQDPAYENVLIRSTDDGRTWTPPSVVPDYGWQGAECASLTELRNGRLLLNQWRFRWYPLPLARQRALTEPVTFPLDLIGSLAGSPDIDADAELRRDPERLAPWARGKGTSHVHVSDDRGATWRTGAPIDVAPFSGGYGMRGAVEPGDGSIVLPLSDAPDYERVFVVRSEDGGLSWSKAIVAAARSGAMFEEPAPLLLPSGRILMALRENTGRTILTIYSDDGGETWSEPRPTGIDGYPAHLMLLAGGEILCTCGYRKPPFAIRAVRSTDGGVSWRTEMPVTIRENLPDKDLGYPVTLPLPDKRLFTIYYARDRAGITGIHGSIWRL